MFSPPRWLSYLSDQCWQRTALGTPVTAKASFLEETSGQVGSRTRIPERVSSVGSPITSLLRFLLPMISWRVIQVFSVLNGSAKIELLPSSCSDENLYLQIL